jgi:hypothetical protein
MNAHTLRWARKSPNSNNNFDLVLSNPQNLDSERMKELLDGILREKHRGLTLNTRAWREFQRWFDRPDTHLKSEAYVLLSNWFMTRAGDRNSMVASRCEALWDALFPCRPLKRLSSPRKNFLMLPSEFAGFWQRVLKAQGEDVRHSDDTREESNVKQIQTCLVGEADVDGAREEPNCRPIRMGKVSEGSDGSTNGQLRMKFSTMDGKQFEVEGSPGALADFVRTMNSSS